VPLRQWEEVQEVLRASSIKLFATAIISLWLVMMALLIRREVLVPHFGRGKVLAYVERETDTWMGLYMPNGVCIGVLNTQTRPEARNGEYGQFLRFWARLSMTVLSVPTEIHMAGQAWASRDHGLSEFDFSVSSAEHKMRIAATIDDGLLDGQIHTGGETIPLKVPVGENLLFSGNMGTAALNVPGLEPGDEVYVDTFDPMTLSVTKAEITCVGEETVDYGGEEVQTKVLVTRLGGITSKAWVSYDDEVLYAETPFGFTLKKLTQEEALEALRPSDAEGLIGMMAVRPTGQRPVRGASAMDIVLTNLPEGTMPPEDDTQRMVAQGRFDIRTPEEPAASDGPALDEETRAAFLKSDAFVQADHPKITARAKDIVGDEPDVWQRALRIYEWVYDTIEKTSVMSLPSALDVLKTKEGDCNEHTVLFTALARAAGIPTRIAIGVAWSDELEGFYYHAWPEVYVGRWTWLDPTLGQPVADAAHIKLLTGSIEKWPQLLPYLGQLQVEVLKIQ